MYKLKGVVTRATDPQRWVNTQSKPSSEMLTREGGDGPGSVEDQEMMSLILSGPIAVSDPE